MIAFRWKVERTFAWLMQGRLLVRDYAKSVASAAGWIWCAMFRLLTRRLFPTK